MTTRVTLEHAGHRAGAGTGSRQRIALRSRRISGDRCIPAPTMFGDKELSIWARTLLQSKGGWP